MCANFSTVEIWYFAAKYIKDIQTLATNSVSDLLEPQILGTLDLERDFENN